MHRTSGLYVYIIYVVITQKNPLAKCEPGKGKVSGLSASVNLQFPHQMA